MSEFATSPPPTPYPVRLQVDYPEQSSRWKALFRLFLAIPVLLFLALLTGGSAAGEAGRRGGEIAAAGTSGVILAIWVTIIVRQRIPRWLFDFQAWVNRWALRAIGYTVLLTDEYPAFEADYPIRYEIDYPERLSRWRVLIWKTITSIPHLFILIFLWLGLVVVVLIAWFAILFTGKFPRGLHSYVVGVMRWGARVQAYLYSLTDEFPPFSMRADASQGGRDSYVISSVLGLLGVGVLIGAVAAFLTIMATESQHIRSVVSYDRLRADELQVGEGVVRVHSGVVRLVSATDPADDRYAFYQVPPGERLIELQLDIENRRGRAGDNDIAIRASRFTVRDAGGEEYDAVLATVNGTEIAPYDIDAKEFATVKLLFELPAGVEPVALDYRVLSYVDFPDFGEKITYLFQ